MAAGLTDWKDILVLGIYFVFVLAVGIWASCRKGRETVNGYFLAGRNMVWLPIGFSMFASNIGSEHFIGLAGSGANSGIAVVAFEWGAVLLLLLLGWVFLPVYLTSGWCFFCGCDVVTFPFVSWVRCDASLYRFLIFALFLTFTHYQVFTMPEYLQRRFGGSRLRLYLSIISTLLYIAIKISVDVYAGAIFIQQAAGWNTYLSIAVLLVVTGIYTIIGGLAAVIYTDTLQTVIMLVGSIVLSVIAFIKVGGIMALHDKYMEAIPSTYDLNSTSTCGLPRQDAFHIFRDPVNSNLPWPGVIIRSTLASLWYWCTDQVNVQRALSAKNIAHARGATITAGYLKILPLFLMILPGMISRVLYTDEVACVVPEICKAVCDNPSGCSNIAYPKLVLELAPTGVKGIMLAVMMSAVMSSLTSVFNSAASLFTIDIWLKIREKASEKELLISGRLFVVVLVGLSIAWVPLIQSAQGAQLFIYMQAVTGYIAPPLCVVFILAVFVPRINEQGAFWGIVIVQLVGVIRLILDFVYPSPSCDEKNTRPVLLAAVNFTYFSAFLLALSAVVMVVISLCTEKPDPDMLEGLTFWSVRKIGNQGCCSKSDTKSNDEEQECMDEREYTLIRNGSHKRVSHMTGASREIQLTVANAEVIDDGKLVENGSIKEVVCDLYLQKMKLSRKMNLFLNINALILLCVFTACYIIFA